MNSLPQHLQKREPVRNICLILEGLEEQCYFERLLELNVFSRKYNIKLINAKGATNIAPRFQAAFASDSYAITLVGCDLDRSPDMYNKVKDGLDEVLGEGNGEKVITFTRPCTLQLILLHFGEVELKSQSKIKARPYVEKLTGVSGYNAHSFQLQKICGAIYQRSWQEMLGRLEQLSTDPIDIPSSNMGELFERLSSDSLEWINELNEAIFN